MRRRHGRHQGRIGELALQEVDAAFAGALAERVAGVRILEVRIDLRDVGDAVERAGAGAHEVGVERQVAVEPVDLRRERRTVAGHAEQPLRRALEHGYVGGFQRDLGDHLVAGAAGADHRHALALQVEFLRPPRRVPRGAGEGFGAGDGGEVRAAEKADGGDHRARADRAGAFWPDEVDLPFVGGVVPGQGFDLGLELDVAAQVELVGDPVEILHVLLPCAERIGVGEVHAEEVGVGAAWGIDAGAGVAVLPPGAADAGVLFEDGEREAGLLQLDGGVQAAHAGADHRHGEFLQPRGIGLFPPVQRADRRVERQLVDVVLEVLALQRLAEHQGQAGGKPVAGADVDAAGAAVAVGFEELDGLAAEQRDVGFGCGRGDVEVAGQHHLHAGSRHFRIAGELVEQAAQDHRIGVGDRVLDHRVVRSPQLRPGNRFLLGHALRTPRIVILARLEGGGGVKSRAGGIGHGRWVDHVAHRRALLGDTFFWSAPC